MSKRYQCAHRVQRHGITGQTEPFKTITLKLVSFEAPIGRQTTSNNSARREQVWRLSNSPFPHAIGSENRHRQPIPAPSPEMQKDCSYPNLSEIRRGTAGRFARGKIDQVTLRIVGNHPSRTRPIRTRHEPETAAARLVSRVFK
ncbi:hypothetical protein [Schlesneria sp. T3-172]|uniref:hypothetical protein n=1 Tax=Schlesneria sphaerica TaxID=3373610 RepID=UPI0037C9202D